MRVCAHIYFCVLVCVSYSRSIEPVVVTVCVRESVCVSVCKCLCVCVHVFVYVRVHRWTLSLCNTTHRYGCAYLEFSIKTFILSAKCLFVTAALLCPGILYSSSFILDLILPIHRASVGRSNEMQPLQHAHFLLVNFAVL